MFDPLRPKKVLAIGAHADDIDFGASGAMAKWAQHGADIHYLVITDGQSGSADVAVKNTDLMATRQDEQRAAAKAIGAGEVHFFDYTDGQLEVTMDLKRRIVKLIRQVRPDTVIVMDPSVLYVASMGFINHPDHRAAGQATLDAVYPLARDHLSFPELYAAGLEPHKVQHLLMLNFETNNYYEDITDTFELKHKALRCHASQFSDDNSVWQLVTQQAEDMGKQADCIYAEGFVRIDIIPV